MPSLAINTTCARPLSEILRKALPHGQHRDGESRSTSLRTSGRAYPRRDSGFATTARREEAELAAGDVWDAPLNPKQLDLLLHDTYDSDRVLHVLDRAQEQRVPLTTMSMVTAAARLAKGSRRCSDVATNPLCVALLDDIWAELKQRPNAFSPHQLTDLLFSLSKISGATWQGLGHLEQEILRRLPELASHDIADVLWGFAKAERGRDSYAAVSMALVSRGFAGFSAHDMADTVWAFATAGQLGTQMYRAVNAELAARGLKSFTPPELSLLLYAYAIAGYNGGLGGEGVYDMAEMFILDRGLGDFSAHDVCNCLWAFTCAGRGSTALYAAIEGEFVGRGVKAFGVCNVAHALWALAANGRDPNKATRAMVRECARSLDSMPLGVLMSLKSYIQAYVFLYVGEYDLDPAYDAIYRSARSWTWPHTFPKVFSPIHAEVSGILKGMGVAHQDFGFSFDDVAYANIHIGYRGGGCSGSGSGVTVVELGGAFPQYRDSQVLRTSVEFKRRYYARYRWQVVSIPFYEWEAAGTRAGKEKYLREKLGECGMDIAGS
eukprot:jgi/Mesvir1/29706/Mv00939-RA.1